MFTSASLTTFLHLTDNITKFKDDVCDSKNQTDNNDSYLLQKKDNVSDGKNQNYDKKVQSILLKEHIIIAAKVMTIVEAK